MQRIEKAISVASRLRPNNVLITETFEVAREQAKIALQKGLQPFPIVVKDCFAVTDVSMTCASRMLETYVPPYSSTIVERLIGKGGCIIGKANSDEFSMGTSSALGHFGPVKSALSNPHTIEEDWVIPGGSSGGSAVAVQSEMADMAIGSDTGGSTRNPASFNGIFGLKPTYGVLSRHGLVPLVNSLDVPSIFARSAEECRAYLDVMCGVDVNDSTSLDLPDTSGAATLKGLRVGIPKEYHDAGLSPAGWRAWNSAAAALSSAGATIVPLSLPHTPLSLTCYHVLSATDVASNMARYDSVGYGHRSASDASTFELYSSSREEAFNSVVRRRIHAGNYFLMKEHRSTYYSQALKVRRLISDELCDAFNEVDVVLTPTASGPPPLFSQLHASGFNREHDDDYYTQPANMAGVPAISVPAGVCGGLPVGVQLMGARLADRLVCDVAALLSKEMKGREEEREKAGATA